MRSKLEDEFAAQLHGAGIGFDREFQFCEWRRWRADMRPYQSQPIPGEYFARTLDDVLVEIQGGSWVGGRHGTGSGFEKDAEKLAHAAALGWRVVTLTGKSVKDGSGLRLVEAAMGIRPLQAPPPKPKRPRAAKRALSGHRGKRQELPDRVKRAAGL